MLGTAYAGKALGLLRIVASLLFIEHATSKLFGFPPFPMGALPPVGSFFWIAAVIEIVAASSVLSDCSAARSRSSCRAKWQSATG